jgi:hypothetical protein
MVSFVLPSHPAGIMFDLRVLRDPLDQVSEDGRQRWAQNGEDRIHAPTTRRRGL